MTKQEPQLNTPWRAVDEGGVAAAYFWTLALTEYKLTGNKQQT